MDLNSESDLISLADLYLTKALAERDLQTIKQVLDDFHSFLLHENGGDYSFFPLSESLHRDMSTASEHGGNDLMNLLRGSFKKREKFKRRGIDRYPKNKKYFHFEDLSQLVRTSMRLHYFSERFPEKKFLPDSRVFTFGSCFAINIHKHLISKGLNSRCMPMLEATNSPQYNLKYFKSKYKYNSSMMVFIASDNDLNNVTEDWHGKQHEPAHLREDQTWFTTTHSDRGAILRKEVRNAEVIIFTVGTALKSLKESNGSCMETVESQKNALKEVIGEILKINKKAHIVLTLSPIPIEIVSGWEKNSSSVEADCVQKSISRVALYELFHSDFKDVENISYFPSFEIVRWISPLSTNGSPVWQDFHHPNPEIIKTIANVFESVILKQSKFISYSLLLLNSINEIEPLVEKGCLVCCVMDLGSRCLCFMPSLQNFNIFTTVCSVVSMAE